MISTKPYKYTELRSVQSSTAASDNPSTLHPLSQAIQRSPHLMKQRELGELMNAVHVTVSKNNQHKPQSNTHQNAAHKEMLILNSQIALEEERRKKKRF